MNTKLSLVLFVSSLVVARAATTVPITTAAAAVTSDAPGLLGTTYTGLDFGYTHHVESEPNALRRFGLVSSRPLIEEARNLDGAFRYNYTRGTGDITYQQHDVAMSFVGYAPLADTHAFFRGDLGWAWNKTGSETDNGFMFVVGVGLEILLSPRAALTPYINYKDSPHLDVRATWFGVQSLYRFDQAWSGTFTVQMDDHHNIEYMLGLLRRF
jgi:hypothetical protein